MTNGLFSITSDLYSGLRCAALIDRHENPITQITTFGISWPFERKKWNDAGIVKPGTTNNAPHWFYFTADSVESQNKKVLYESSRLPKIGEDFELTYTFDRFNETYSVYLNGLELLTGALNGENWDIVFNTELGYGIFDNYDYIELGRMCYGGTPYGGHMYSSSDAYSLKLYERPLTSNEVLANYNASVSYHNILLNGGNSETQINSSEENEIDLNNID